jgi:hypothetical protein
MASATMSVDRRQPRLAGNSRSWSAQGSRGKRSQVLIFHVPEIIP